jgi:hypothetical protein
VYLISGIGVCFFPSFFLFRIVCVRYLIAIGEKDSNISWILDMRICRSWWCVVCVWLKMVVACKSATFQYARFFMLFILEFFNDEYVCVVVILDLG